MLLQFLQLEANKLELAIHTVTEKHSTCCHEAKCEHSELLREEYKRLAKLYATKEEQMNMLTHDLIGSVLQQVSF